MLEIIDAVRDAVGCSFPIGIRINSSDQLEGGLGESDALKIIAMLDRTSIDLIDISGGTYFPGAKPSSDGAGKGPYFLEFANRAKAITNIPLMVTGGFKRRAQAIEAIDSGAADIVGLARTLVLDPNIPENWFRERGRDPDFPRFEATVPGGVTAWYTMRLTALGDDREAAFDMTLPDAVRAYEARDADRSVAWRQRFASRPAGSET